MKSSSLPNYERKIIRISALHTTPQDTPQGRNLDNFLFIFWEKRWLYKFILKINWPLICQGQHQLAASAILLLKAKVQIRGLTMMKTNRHFSISAIKSGLQRLWHRRPHRRALQRPYTVVIFTFLTPYIRQSTIKYAGLLGRWDKRLVDQGSDVPSVIFFSWNLAKFLAKTLSISFLIFFQNYKNEVLSALSPKETMKKIILRTSDAWLTSHLSHLPSKPAYYIVDCRISS